MYKKIKLFLGIIFITINFSSLLITSISVYMYFINVTQKVHSGRAQVNKPALVFDWGNELELQKCNLFISWYDDMSVKPNEETIMMTVYTENHFVCKSDVQHLLVSEALLAILENPQSQLYVHASYNNSINVYCIYCSLIWMSKVHAWTMENTIK